MPENLNLKEFNSFIDSLSYSDPRWLQIREWWFQQFNSTATGLELKPEMKKYAGRTLVSVYFELVYSKA